MSLVAENRPNSPASPRSCRRLPRWKKSLFAVFTTCLFLALTEAVLTLLGVRPILYDQDPFVGFSSRVPLFVEKRDDDGEKLMTTAENRLNLFNRQQFPRHKGPGVRRVFCMGGSTTYGRPYDDTTSFAGWLREFLPVADASGPWEVVNAGGISYASYRVAMLVEELADYQPDLFIVYCGHNEFLERRTYRDMLDSPMAFRNVRAMLNRTRTYSAAKRLFGHKQGAGLMASDGQDLLPAEVDAILDRSMGPEDYRRDDGWQQQVQEHYRMSLNRMTAIARSAGAKIVFVTPASNLRDFTPFKSEHRDGLSEDEASLFLGYLQVASDAFVAERFPEALTALDRAHAIDDRHARMHFLRGRVLLRLGRLDEAREAFLHARDNDICPLRALTPMRHIVLDVAKAQGVPVIDFVAVLDAQAEHGIPGADLFLDHVHPKIDGHRQLALRLIEEMQEMQLVRPPGTWDEAAVETVTARVYGGLDSAAHANALRNLSKVLGWAGKFEEAEQLALLAVQGLPYDANAHYMAGMAHRRQDRLDPAIKELELAVELSPTYLRALRALGSALIEKGEADRAVQFYEEALELEPADYILHSDVGFLFLAEEEWDAAADHFQLALIVNSEDALSYAGLGHVAEGRDEVEAARGYYQQALSLDPECQQAVEGIQRCRR